MAHAALPPRPAFTHDNPRVQIFTAPGGVVHLVGVSRSGVWVEERWIRIERYSMQNALDMEKEVLAFEATEPGPRLTLSSAAEASAPGSAPKRPDLP